MSGSELRAWMVATGWTRQQLAALFRRSPGLVDLWLKDEVRVPARVERLLRRGTLAFRHPRGNKLPLNHEPLCPRGACRSCSLRRTWASNGRVWRDVQRGDAWTTETDARLREYAGALPLGQIAERLEAEFGVHRSWNAVRTRAMQLGVSLAAPAALYSRDQVALLFGVKPHTVRAWLERGWLAGPQVTPRRNSHYVIPFDALVAFVEQHPTHYAWQRMRPGRLRELARMAALRDPFYPVADVARFLGVARRTVRGWIARGDLRATWGWQRAPAWFVRRSALLAWQRQRLPRWQRRAS